MEDRAQGLAETRRAGAAVGDRVVLALVLERRLARPVATRPMRRVRGQPSGQIGGGAAVPSYRETA